MKRVGTLFVWLILLGLLVLVLSVSSTQGAEYAWLLLPIALVVLLYVVARRARRGAGNASLFAMRRSLARPIPDAAKVKFTDVGGCDEAKQALGDVVDYLKDPKRWSQAGVRLPRGVLLEGPPGCGKTLLARAVAGETNARFFLASAAEFVEVFVGVGAARVRGTFEMARKAAPAVIFIDELDAIGRYRGAGIGPAAEEREQTLNQLLICLDGIEGREPVAVIAATNRSDILDAALVRPGRFDRRVRVPPLCRNARLETLRIHTRNKLLAADVSLETLADRTEGFNGARLENLANEAALLAVRRARNAADGRVELRPEDFQRALLPTAGQPTGFGKLDALLIESTTQLAEPSERAAVRVFLDGESIEGELVWANAHFLKLRSPAGHIFVPKGQVSRIEALDGAQ